VPLPFLTTARLTIRPLTFDHLDAFAAIFADAETMAAYGRTFTRDESRGWIERSLLRYDRDGFALFALERTEDGLYVGDCGPSIQVVDGVDEPEIGWHIRRDLWGRGYATESALALRDWFFDDVGRDRLISLVAPSNAASCRVAEKIGMRVERETVAFGGPHRVYAMTPGDRSAPWDQGAGGPAATGS
jgi:RimJ/RimL family protein N-acetyltransferase